MSRHGTRLPDFVVIGTMKSGTTTLFRWLEQHPDTALPSVKEPAFFSDDGVWRRGLSWYGSLFAHAAPGQLTGEASVDYTDPERAAIAADRINRVVPGARLLCLLRHPVDRMRSHYRHEVQRGRERASFVPAITRPGNPYVERSSYYDCLLPWLDRFASHDLCVLRFESLVDERADAWYTALEHLGLAQVPPPGTAHNVTEEKEQYTTAMRWLWERGLVNRVSPLVRGGGVRKAARKVLLRNDGDYTAQLATSRDDVPDHVSEALWSSTERLEAALELGELWPRQSSAAPPSV